MKNNIIKILIVFIVVGLLFYTAEHFQLNNYLSLNGFNNYHKQIVAYRDLQPKLFIFIYIIAYVLLITCCIPGTILFDLLAGFLFGYYLGSILVIFSYLLGAFCNFFLIRYIFKDMEFLHRFDKFRNLVHGSGKYGLLLNLISLRLIAVIPFWILNIVAALLKVRISTFLLSTLIGITPTSIIYVVIGDGVKDLLSHNQQLTPAFLTNPKIWLPLFILSLLLMLPNIIKSYKRAKNK